MAVETDITFFRGDTVTIKFTINDGAAVPAAKDITGSTVIWALAKAQGKAPLFTKTVGSGITLTDEANGLLEVLIDPADTASLKGGTYYHELEITDASSNVSTSAFGAVTISADSIP